MAPPPRREEEFDDEAEADTARERERDKPAAGMTVIGDAPDAAAQPEPLAAHGRASASKASGEGKSGARSPEKSAASDEADAEDAPPRRTRRRVSRKPKTEETAPAEAREAAPSGFEVVEPGAANGDAGAAADEGGWTEGEPAPIAGAAVS